MTEQEIAALRLAFATLDLRQILAAKLLPSDLHDLLLHYGGLSQVIPFLSRLPDAYWAMPPAARWKRAKRSLRRQFAQTDSPPRYPYGWGCFAVENNSPYTVLLAYVFTRVRKGEAVCV